MNTAILYTRSLRLVASRRPATFVQRSFVAGSSGSDSITYSGGQATEGQGGFYGSGGARAQVDPLTNSSDTSRRQQLLALAADVEKITHVMEDIDQLEDSLRELQTQQGATSKTTMELKNAIKKKLTAHDVIESLNRLEVQGQPVWGLSTKERELIMAAREKMNES